MKKLTVLITLLISLAVGASAQNGGGLFQKGPESREYGNRTENDIPMLPTQHGETTDQNGPLGSSAAIMLGLGAAYLVAKKRKSVRKATLALALFVAAGAPFAAMAQQTLYTSYTATQGTGTGNENEGYRKIFDNNTGTKWCQQAFYHGYTYNAFVDFQTATPIVPKKYVLTTANDNANYPGRNPKSWTIQAKLNQGDDWTYIANVSDDFTMQNVNFTDYTFLVDNDYNASYQYFRLIISEIQGGTNVNVMQLSEFKFHVINGLDHLLSLRCTAYTASTATLSWNEAGQASWQICLDGDENNLIETSTNPFTLTGLTPDIAHTAKIRTNLGNGQYSLWSDVLTFTPTTILFVEDFENGNSIPSGWSSEGSGSWTFGDYNPSLSGSYNGHGAQCAYFGGHGSGNTNKLISPILNLQGTGTFELSFMRFMPHLNAGITQHNELRVYYRTSGNGDWTLINTYTDNAEAWTTETLTLPNTNGSYQIAFEATDKAPVGEWVYRGGPVLIDYVKITQKHTTEITGYGEGSGNWYLIASPLAAPAAPMDVTDMTSNNYDLYRFNQSANKEWENWKATGTNHYQFTMEPGQGYLYANSGNVTLQFSGMPYNSNGQVPLVYDANAPHFAGWNLIGNPFGTAATIDRPFYRMNNGGTALSAQVEANNSVAAMEGVFVQATDANQTATFTPGNGGAKGGETPLLNISVSRNRGEAVDNAIVRFDGGQTLDKFTLHENDSRLYIPQDGQEHAIANAEATGELPLNFLPEADGTYTLCFESKAIEFSYLHLIDNRTGADVDLMATPSYTFEAHYSDYASRFRLVFSICGDANGDNETFAFINNGNIIITADVDNATLQIVDVMGRVIVSRKGDVSGNVSTGGMMPGVYVLRLINGDDIRTQKIVIE